MKREVGSFFAGLVFIALGIALVVTYTTTKAQTKGASIARGAYVFDAVTKKWEQTKPFAGVLREPQIVRLADGRIALRGTSKEGLAAAEKAWIEAGGAFEPAPSNLEAFDPVTRTWAEMPLASVAPPPTPPAGYELVSTSDETYVAIMRAVPGASGPCETRVLRGEWQAGPRLDHCETLMPSRVFVARTAERIVLVYGPSMEASVGHVLTARGTDAAFVETPYTQPSSVDAMALLGGRVALLTGDLKLVDLQTGGIESFQVPDAGSARSMFATGGVLVLVGSEWRHEWLPRGAAICAGALAGLLALAGVVAWMLGARLRTAKVGVPSVAGPFREGPPREVAAPAPRALLSSRGLLWSVGLVGGFAALIGGLVVLAFVVGWAALILKG